MKSIKLPSWTRSLLGFDPVPAPPHAFAVDRTRLVYGGFVRSGKALQFREYHSEELPAETFQDGLLGGSLTDVGAFDGIVRRLVGRVSGAVKEASLTVPDAWLRVAFAELDDLPRGARERDEVLRWKLKQQVPFSPDDLRLDGVSVSPLPGQSEAFRVLVAFALDSVLSQLELAFTKAGVKLGRITNSSLPALSALGPGGQGGGTVLAFVEEEGYSLVFAHDGEPVLHRFKAGTSDARFVVRDLRLTRDYLDRSVPGFPIDRLVLCAPASLEGSWVDWLSEGFDHPAEAFSARHLPASVGLSPELSGHDIAALYGAAQEAVA
ncbi:MAG: hypothetical protein AAF604_07130 [Acidobacteriota bacterium]